MEGARTKSMDGAGYQVGQANVGEGVAEQTGAGATSWRSLKATFLL